MRETNQVEFESLVGQTIKEVKRDEDDSKSVMITTYDGYKFNICLSKEWEWCDTELILVKLED